MESIVNTINGAAQNSVGVVSVNLSGGSIVGRGISGSDRALDVCGGNLDKILSSFGGGAISGGDTSFGGKNIAALNMCGGLAEQLYGGLSQQQEAVKQYGIKLAALIDLGEEAMGNLDGDEQQVVHDIVENLKEALSKIASADNHKYHATMEDIKHFVESNNQFVAHIGQHKNAQSNADKAKILSMTFSSLNQLKGLADQVGEMDHYSSHGKKLLFAATNQIAELAKPENSSNELLSFVGKWHQIYEERTPEVMRIVGGADEGRQMDTKPIHLSERLLETQNKLRKVVNEFISEFAKSISGIASVAETMASEFGTRIDYDEHTIQFFDSFKRLSEYINDPVRLSKIYQYLLGLNQDTEVDSREVKDRFLSTLNALARDADSMDKTQNSKKFAEACRSAVAVVEKYNDQVKIFNSDLRKNGGANTETMNELFSADISKINISALLNPFENLKTAIKKIDFFRGIAMFRSNLERTNKELSTYTKDYTKSVGKTIGDAINKINSEYTAILNDISDNKAGLGLEINMYNESLPNGKTISKEKLKTIYKWQRDARIGLYKTIEAIDLYLLHFTEAVTKNPDAVADLHKLLSATKIIAKWYDAKAGDNIIRVFESFNELTPSDTIDKGDFITATYSAAAPAATRAAAAAGVAVVDPANAGDLANLTNAIGGERANEIYERSRRAVEGVVVLKNIISYFITISEKYGDFKNEKNIFMSPSNIYKNLVNYIWVSAFDMNANSIEILTEQNELKRVVSYADTKLTLATAQPTDPEKYGINFNKHAIDKLRILKCLNDVKLFAHTSGSSSFKQLQNLVTSIFARLGKTKYIYEMARFGVYDLTQMDTEQIREFIIWLRTTSGANNRVFVYINNGTRINIDDVPANIDGLTTTISNIPKDQRATSVEIAVVDPDNDPANDPANLANVIDVNLLNNLEQFNRLNQIDEFQYLPAFVGFDLTGAGAPATGFLQDLLQGLTGNGTEELRVAFFERTSTVLKYCMTQMLDKYNADNKNSVFTIDDTYFVLIIKAIAGKVMAAMGINSILKKPDDISNAFMTNQTRLIMGGAASDDTAIIDDAVELYVRLPLLVEFYRRIFEQGNKDFKQESVRDRLDDEQIAFVPEVGSVWSGLIINIFDKSKHIKDGIYTSDNMKKIVAEVNSIYKSYKGTVTDDELVRHIMMELVAEVNRRYGIIKRNELQQYYRVLNATKLKSFTVNESGYTNNDIDILNESLEFQEKSPSDEYIKLQETLSDKSVTSEEKINKLTDYKILKEFREKIQNELTAGANAAAVPGGAPNQTLTIKDRIRSLKKAVSLKTSMDEKYDMIIKAIEEADAMNQASNDIFLAFHEFVVMPFRTLQQLHKSLELFLLSMLELIRLAELNQGQPGLDFMDSELLREEIKVGGVNTRLIDAITSLLNVERGKITSTKTENRTTFQRLSFGGQDAIATYLHVVAGAGDYTYYNQFDDVGGSASTDGLIQVALIKLLTQFSTNSGDLVKMSISPTSNRITLDLSEYQKVSEHLFANVKFMVDKFTGLVPTQLISKVTSVRDGVYKLEEKFINRMFNKINRRESERDVLCVDTAFKLMPLVSDIIYKSRITTETLSKTMITERVDTVQVQTSEVNQCKPIIRDAFNIYRTNAKIFTTSGSATYISHFLFNPKNNISLADEERYSSGILQTFNTLIANYLNDLYDSQSKKIYTKTFASFSGSTLVDALNGQSFPDFSTIPGVAPQPGNPRDYHVFPQSPIVLSSTLAYVMKVMSNRVNQVTGMKIHEISSLQEVSPHVLEKYRSLIPMYLRIFKAFVRRCAVYRKILGKVNVVDTNFNFVNITQYFNTFYKDHENDADDIRFAKSMDVFPDDPDAGELKDAFVLYLDEIISCMGAIIQDAESVQEELMATDTTVSLYYDIKRDFTKNYFGANKDYPFAPLSILAMAYPNKDGVVPIYGQNVTDNKFLYGLRCMLMDDFKLSSQKVPYLKKLITEFNGFTTPTNAIDEAKFNDVLQYVSRAANYIYDLRFFNGLALSKTDMLSPKSTYEQEIERARTTAIGNLYPGGAAALPLENAIATEFSRQLIAEANTRLINVEQTIAFDANDAATGTAARNGVEATIRAHAAAIANDMFNLGKDSLVTFQEGNKKSAALTVIESVSAIDSRNKIAEWVKAIATNAGFAPFGPVGPVGVDPNPRAKVMMVNILDLNIIPINVHSLMREIPLANLYNYAMTFDSIVGSMNIDVALVELLKEPYQQINVDTATDQLLVNSSSVGMAVIPMTFDSIYTPGNENNLRFLKDIIFDKILLHTVPAAGGHALALTGPYANQRMDSKLLRNILFLSLVQMAIKKKVKSELEFINTRVVTNTNAVSDVITNATVDNNTVDDTYFKF